MRLAELRSIAALSVVLAVLLGACGSSSDAVFSDGVSIEMVLPDGVDAEIVYETTVDVLKRRIEGLDGVTGAEFDMGGGSITVHLGGITDSELAVRTLTVPGQLSFRPVLALYLDSPSVADPDSLVLDGDDGVDPILDPLNEVGDDGLSVDDDVEYRSLLSDAEDFIWEVGSINVRFMDGTVVEFPTGSDISDAQATFLGEDLAGQWVVVPEFTDDGGRRFTEATAYLAQYPMGDDRRSMAIVIDGTVLAAPSMSADVLPSEGLAPDGVVITIGSGENAEQEALSLAAALRYGALPVVFESVVVSAP
jgi:preprotein translocase subunit SecD